MLLTFDWYSFMWNDWAMLGKSKSIHTVEHFLKIDLILKMNRALHEWMILRAFNLIPYSMSYSLASSTSIFFLFWSMSVLLHCVFLLCWRWLVLKSQKTSKFLRSWASSRLFSSFLTSYFNTMLVFNFKLWRKVLNGHLQWSRKDLLYFDWLHASLWQPIDFISSLQLYVWEA